MKSAVKKAMCLSAAAVVCLTGAAFGSTALPYGTGFEGAFNPNADPWISGGSGVATDPTHVAGSQGVVVSNDSLTLSVNPNQYTNVWMQVWAKPVAGDSDPAVSGVSGAFYIKTNGELRVYHQSGSSQTWTTVASGLPTSGNQWIGFVVHADYTGWGAGIWDIYYTTGAYGTNLVKVNVSPIPFPTGATNRMGSLTVESGSAAYVDAVGVSKGYQHVSNAVCDGTYVKPYAFAAAQQTNNFPMPVYASVYTNTGYNLLSAWLGDNLRAGLQTLDQIKIYGTVNEFWTYEISGGAWSAIGGAPAPSALEILPSTVIQLARSGGSTETFGFFQYNDAITMNGSKPAGAPSYPATMNLYGTSGGHSGFTSVNWPGAAANVNALPFKNPDADLIVGDRLYLENNSFPGRYDEHWWNGSMWMYWAQVPGASLPGRANMWIRRQTADATEPVSVTF